LEKSRFSKGAAIRKGLGTTGIDCIRLPVALRRVNSDTVNYCGRERLSSNGHKEALYKYPD